MPLADVDETAFEARVLQAERPVVVDFWAPWCGPCEAVERVLEQLAADRRDRADFVRVNVDEAVAVAAQYGVLALPTVTLFEGGEPRASVVGAHGERRYVEAFGAWLA